jgi:hypothetical protein
MHILLLRVLIAAHLNLFLLYFEAFFLSYPVSVFIYACIFRFSIFIVYTLFIAVSKPLIHNLVHI